MKIGNELSKYIEIKKRGVRQGGVLPTDLALLYSELAIKEVIDMEGV